MPNYTAFYLSCTKDRIADLRALRNNDSPLLKNPKGAPRVVSMIVQKRLGCDDPDHGDYGLVHGCIAFNFALDGYSTDRFRTAAWLLQWEPRRHYDWNREAEEGEVVVVGPFGCFDKYKKPLTVLDGGEAKEGEEGNEAEEAEEGSEAKIKGGKLSKPSKRPRACDNDGIVADVASVRAEMADMRKMWKRAESTRRTDMKALRASIAAVGGKVDGDAAMESLHTELDLAREQAASLQAELVRTKEKAQALQTEHNALLGALRALNATNGSESSCS